MSIAGHKTIVVTGGAGFVGSRLCARLAAEGHRVISLDNYFAGSRDSCVPGVDYREGHTKNIAAHIPETPDIIFHLGEYARVEQSLLEPDVVYDLNVLGTEGVIEFWKENQKEKPCKLVYAGSSTKFGDGGLARNATPYASSKADNTEKVKAIGDEFSLPYAITYFYNVFGPGERAGAYGTVIEMFKQMYLKGTPISVVLPGTQERNFTHVDDIVDGLVLVAEKGQGDEYGLGNEKKFSMLEVARLFGDDIVMLPERAGNRMSSALDTSKARALGWEAVRRLEDYLQEFLNAHPRPTARERRVLVFSTTFHPVSGPAEEALIALMRAMPDVEFDIVTTAFTQHAKHVPSPSKNAHIHRVGFGNVFDKYLLPFWGFAAARSLYKQHGYLFAWSIFASYAALAALFLKRLSGVPLLITLADQNLDDMAAWKRTALARLLTDADQVYGTEFADEKKALDAAHISGIGRVRHSMGQGDAFANQLRFAYASILKGMPPRPRRSAAAAEAAPPVPPPPARIGKGKLVLIFSLAYFPKHVGGAEVAIKEITDRISPDKIEFHMVTLRFDSTLPKVERIGNVLVHRIGFTRQEPSMADLKASPLKWNKYLYQALAPFYALRLHWKYHYDGVWAMMAHAVGIAAGIFTLFAPRVRYVLTLQEGDPPEYIEALAKPAWPLFKRAFTRADAVQVISSFLGRWAKRMGYPGAPVLVPNAVDAKRFAHGYPAKTLDALKETLGKKTTDVFLITTSRLVHKNAADDVIRALPMLPKKVKFLILGIGPDEGMLKDIARREGVEDRVVFLGQIGHEELPKYLHASDIFIRPSRSEGMGNSFVEAFAAGIPVIATQEGGIADFLFDAKRNPDIKTTGWAVDKDSPEQIAAAVKDIIAHPECVQEVVATAKMLAFEKYDWDKIARAMREDVFSVL
ncbi:MAG: NAD-dependent epimerase/dehydratase family protein [Patescibacteria group bacterium]|nr:NAD-dependent epimerase/dehydratase family protein [Patescibacteria group bacterium]